MTKLDNPPRLSQRAAMASIVALSLLCWAAVLIPLWVA
jgi:hypothetical protein